MLGNLTRLEESMERLLCSQLANSNWTPWHKSVYSKIKGLILEASPQQSGPNYNVWFELNLNKFFTDRFAEHLKSLRVNFSKSGDAIVTSIEFFFNDGQKSIVDISESEDGKKYLQELLSKENTPWNTAKKTAVGIVKGIQGFDFAIWARNTSGIIA
jgi:hypothetical protein